MSITQLLKGSALSAIAATMALTALPTEAEAQNRRFEDRGGQSVQERRQATRENRAQRQQTREVRREAPRREARSEAPRRTQESSRQRVAQESRSRGDERRGRDWNRSERRAEIAQERQGSDWNRGDRRREAPRAIERTRVPASTAARDTRNRSYSDRERNRSYRDGRRDERRGDRAENRQIRRDAYRDGRRDGYRDGQRNYRDRDRNHYYRDRRYYGRGDYRGHYNRWDRHKWRNHHRYNWYDYRRSHRSIFHLGAYYAPYRYHRYSRISIGFYLDDLFFGSRYWINDPWDYRLPEVYGPYRWVRYYDDVLLVNIYTGEVVDVINDFFW